MLVAFEAVPVNDAVMTFAAKFPTPSRLTIAEFVLVLAGVTQVGAPVPFELSRSPAVPTAENR
jgi:hypothetical protein